MNSRRTLKPAAGAARFYLEQQSCREPCILCLGHSCWFGRRAAGIHARQALCVNVLRAARHANAAAICAASRGAHDGFGLCLCHSSSALVGNPYHLGCSRLDCVGWACGLGRDAPVTANSQFTNRPHGTRDRVYHQAMERRFCGCSGCVARQI